MDGLELAFQPQLGQPWFTLFGWPAYQPPAFFWWWFAYDAYAHDIFVTGGFIAAAGGIAAFVVAVAMSVWRAREVKRVTTYGSARWAETSEVRKAGLLDPDGVVVGRWHGAYLRHHGPEHVLCRASLPQRSRTASCRCHRSSTRGAGLTKPSVLSQKELKKATQHLCTGWRKCTSLVAIK